MLLKKSPYKIITVMVVILLVVFLSGFLFLPHAGHLLVAEDPLQESDIIVVLMGSIPDRILEGTDIYQEGYAPKLVMMREDMTGYELLSERGVEIPGRADLSKKAAVDLGVPKDDITILEGDTLSTQDEAVVLRDYLEDKEIDSMILVTSKYHSARSKKIFEKALGSLDKDIEVISRPARYDTFNPEGWWKDREDAKRVVLEYLKVFNFYTREQFKL